MAKGGGGGGSQLAQLKARMHSDGITDRRQMKASAKKRKRGQAASERDEQLARREKLAKIAASAQFNPFEEKTTKPKSVVLGQKVRGATGKPGAARQGGQRERQERLLPEWQNRNKSGSFVDRRFGEGDNGSMSIDDKMLERFTHERQRKASKASLFNLNDAEEEGLTHYGRSLNDMDTFDDINLSDEETGEDKMAHFGGFGDEEEGEGSGAEDEGRQKTKAEVMKELIAKSKMHKQERQQSRMADDQLRLQLDAGFGDLRSLLFAPGSLPEPENEPSAERTADVDAAKKAKEAAYDAAVREMIFERRAKPQDRLKTAEEKAQELAERLREAEEDRQRRMRGDEPESRDGARAAGGDDLADDFELDGVTSADVYGLGKGLQADEAQVDGSSRLDDDGSSEEESNDARDDEEDEEGESEEDDESDSEEDDFSDLADADAAADQQEEADEELGNEMESIVAKSKRKAGRDVPSSLPFTFPCPASLDELLDILASNKVAPVDVPTVIQRVRALHHSSLAAENKLKLQALIGVLIDYVLHLALGMHSQSRSDVMHIVNALVPQLFTLTKAYPIASSEHFVSKLAVMQRNLTRGLAKGATEVEAKTWPGLAECILLKVTGSIWPTSDRSHPVTTPLALLLGQYLSSCRLRNVKDAATLVFLASLVADSERDSKRIVPEALNAVQNAISLLAPLRSKKELAEVNQTFGIPWPDVGQFFAHGLRLSDAAKIDDESATPIDLIDLLLEGKEDEASKARLLLACFTLIERFMSLYRESVAFVELFQPFEMLLVDVIKPFTAPVLEQSRRMTQESITRAVMNAQSSRRALRLQAHRAIPLASHIPKFDQGFNPERKGGRTFDPDSERAELAKLRALAKKERKGAMRELRRDNEFLAEARREAREQEDKRYAKTIDKIMGSLSAERGEEKAYLRDKQKLKRRAGKK